MTTHPATTPARYSTLLRGRLLRLTVSIVTLALGLALFTSPSAQALTPISQGRPAAASSTESSATPASAAFDGDPTTRWSSAFSDPQWLQVDLGSTQLVQEIQLHWEAAYATAFQVQISNDATTWSDLYSTTTGTGGNQYLQVSGTGRYVRLLATARATRFGYSLWEFQIMPAAVSDPIPCQTSSAALNKPTTASSIQSSATPASAAVDGNPLTRWSSAFSDPQWLQVDLGSSQTICKITVSWEAAYARAFQIQLSADGTSWSTEYSTTSGAKRDYSVFLVQRARYVRVFASIRGTGYGYSIWEFGVYLPLQPTPAPPTPTQTPVTAPA